jgi:hypothetical protein
MKTTRNFLLALLLLGAIPGVSSAATSVGIQVSSSGRATVDVGFFYDDLAPYGNWVQRPSYGWVWRPQAVTSSWRPYQRGHWVQTEDGWTWISSEPYGWATYHYGRWYLDPEYGWEWVPGNEWAPAWVSWQEGGDYVGWAPLPPSVEFRGGFGGVDFAAAITPESYLFVPEREFLAPSLDSYYVPRGRQVDIYRQTRNITNYQVVDNRIINQGLPVDRVQRVIGRPVPRYQIADQGENQRHQGGRIQANRVAFFRPQVQKTNVAPPPERPAARRAVVAPGAVPAAPAGREARQPREGRPGAVPAPQANRPADRPQDVQTVQRQRQRQREEKSAPPAAPAAPARPQKQPRPQRQPPSQDQARQPNRPQEARPPQQQQRPPRPQAAPDNRPHGQGQGGQGQGRPADKPHGGKPKGGDNPKDKPPPGGGPGR